MSENELKLLLPGEEYVTACGEKLSIRPVPFGKTIQYIDAISAIISKIVSSGINPEKLMSNDLSGINVALIMKTAFEETIGLMALLLDRPVEWFQQKIDFADGCALLEIIIRQNIDNERAKKNLKTLSLRFSSLFQIPSRSSSAPGIDGKTSKDTQKTKSDSSQKASSDSAI